MELRDIEVFLTLAEELHFRRTADRLYISAGRVSQTIAAMERELGGSLFIRTTRHVRLSPLGERFKKDVGSAVGQLYQSIREARTVAEGVDQVLRVGYAVTVRGTWLIDLASRFEAHPPHTRVSLKALPLGVGFSRLRGGQVDLLVTWSPADGSALRGDGLEVGPPLGREEPALLIPEDHPLASQSSINIEQLADFEILDLSRRAPGAAVDSWTPRLTPSGRVIRTADLEESVFWEDGLLLPDLCVMVARTGVPYLAIRSLLVGHEFPGLRLLPVTGLPPRESVIAWREGLDSQLIRAFIRLSAELRRHDNY